MPTRPTRKAALEAKRKLKENAPGDSEQAVVIAPKPGGQRGRQAPSQPEEPERKNPTARRTRQAAAQAAKRPAQAAAPAQAEAEEWAELPAAALEQQEQLAEPEEKAGGMRAGKEDAEDKAGPSGKKDAAEEEASTAPLPEKVHALSRCLWPGFALLGAHLALAAPLIVTGH
jgi:hypothetical protein